MEGKKIKYYQWVDDKKIVSKEVDTIEDCDYAVVNEVLTKEQLEAKYNYFTDRKWVEENEKVLLHDRVTLKEKDYFVYKVQEIKDDILTIQRMTNNPIEYTILTVHRNQVVAFPPYKHS